MSGKKWISFQQDRFALDRHVLLIHWYIYLFTNLFIYNLQSTLYNFWLYTIYNIYIFMILSPHVLDTIKHKNTQSHFSDDHLPSAFAPICCLSWKRYPWLTLGVILGFPHQPDLPDLCLKSCTTKYHKFRTWNDKRHPFNVDLPSFLPQNLEIVNCGPWNFWLPQWSDFCVGSETQQGESARAFHDITTDLTYTNHDVEVQFWKLGSILKW